MLPCLLTKSGKHVKNGLLISDTQYREKEFIEVAVRFAVCRCVTSDR